MGKSLRCITRTRCRLVPPVGLVLSLVAGAAPAAARVISGAPVSPWQAIPAVQRRAGRHVVLQEVRPSSCTFECTAYWSRLVIHDSWGEEPPRDVTPGGAVANIVRAAAWEGDDGALRLCFVGNSEAEGPIRFLFSGNGGATWSAIPLPAGVTLPENSSYRCCSVNTGKDIGGPVTGGSSSPIRLGTSAVPFVLSLGGQISQPGFWAVRGDGSAFCLSEAWEGALLGSDADGKTFLVGAFDFKAPTPPFREPTSWRVATLDLFGRLRPLFETPAARPWMEGWVTPTGAAYLNVDWEGLPIPVGSRLSSPRSVAFWQERALFEIASADGETSASLFAVPAFDFSGAWVVRRDASATVLSSFVGGGGRVAWSDPARPAVEAIHAGDSGRRLLVQTSRHRELHGDDVTGLAVWVPGGPPPSTYDALVLHKGAGAGFAQLDVEAVAEGMPFFFGSGLVTRSLPQREFVESLGGEAGVVRGSLRQQLLIPASARAPGLFGAEWRTDLVVLNPGLETVRVAVRFLPNPRTSGSAAETTLTLGPNAIEIVPDVLGNLLNLPVGSGALLLSPDGDGSLRATSRTYAASPAGTYGMSVEAVDRQEAAGPGFPLTFAAGLLGEGFRSNLVATNAFEQDSQAEIQLATAAGPAESALSVPVAGNEQTQLTGVAGWMGADASQTGSLRATCRSGRAFTGVIAIDNRTNDPAWFSPDVVGTSFWSGIIPAIVHADGANGARYRTDLFVQNLDASPAGVRMAAMSWDGTGEEQVAELRLEPGESRIVRDVLGAMFGRTGVSRLAFGSTSFTGSGVRMTSRTYTVQPDGSTYGMQLPPLGATQTASAGETLEILGPTGGAGLRTNLSLVELGTLEPGTAPSGAPVTVRIEVLDDRGALLDTFEMQVPPRGGLQVNDLFRRRGLGAGPKAALLRISPDSGLLCAYATTIDNATNDPVYFAGNLASP